MLNSIYSQLNTQMFIICSLASLVLGLFIYMIFSKTHRARKDYSITLILLPFIISIMLMGINSISNSFIILGIFALTRFRTVQYKAEEICAIFMSVVIGILCAMGYVYAAFYGVIIYSLITIIVNKMNFNTHKEFRIYVPEETEFSEVAKVLDKYSKSQELIDYKTTNLGSIHKLTYDVVLKDKVNIKDLINEARIVNGNLEVGIREFTESKS